MALLATSGGSGACLCFMLNVAYIYPKCLLRGPENRVPMGVRFPCLGKRTTGAGRGSGPQL